jgi:transcription elongation factor/antiterminator RfaH
MDVEGSFDKVCWYAVHTKSKQEGRAERNLVAWGVETFFPRVKERCHHRFAGAPSYQIKPLFARYLFARFNARDLLHKVRFTRGVSSIVGFGDGGPTPVDNEIISFIKAQVAEDGYIRLGEELKAGDKVIIQGGLFRQLTGIFEQEIEDGNRVVILLTTIKYQSRVLIDKESVRKIH